MVPGGRDTETGKEESPVQGCETAATGGRWGPASPAPCQEGGRSHLRVDTPRGGCGALATADSPTSGSQALSRPQWCPWAEEPSRVWVDTRRSALWGSHGLLSSSRFQTRRSLPSGWRGCAVSVQVCVLCEVQGIFVWRGVSYV